MLSHDNNELLVRVSRGTPMGDMMRRYWHPVATSQQLPHADGKPLRTRLLGERFVLFRNTQGQVGMLDEFCMHRGASLALGRVEGNSIQCLYHGWRFAVDGKLLETPNNPDPRYKERMKAPAYPTVEYGGLIWAYIGPPESKPPFRKFAAYEVPEQNRFNMRVNVKCNYLALWEGGLDSSHVSVLHTNQARRSWAAQRGSAEVDTAKWRSMDDPSPVFEVEDTAFGYHYAAIRKLPPDRSASAEMRNVRITPAIFPTGRIIGGPNIDFLVWETPNDDESTSTYLTVYSPDPIDKQFVREIVGLDDPRAWSEADPDYKGSLENDFLQNRASMSNNWSGLRGIMQEDLAISLSYGPIYDRSREHLVGADVAVVRVRRRLLEAIKAVQAGESPPGVDRADLRGLTSPDADMPAGSDWRDLAPAHKEPVAAG